MKENFKSSSFLTSNEKAVNLYFKCTTTSVYYNFNISINIWAEAEKHRRFSSFVNQLRFSVAP